MELHFQKHGRDWLKLYNPENPEEWLKITYERKDQLKKFQLK